METVEAYLERKYREIRLLNDCLKSRRRLDRPRSVEDFIKAKFQLTAALRAEHALHDWNATETAWSTSAHPASGPFVFTYDYQRADLSVGGPSFYELEHGYFGKTLYTASGMAAISALLFASTLVFARGTILTLPGTYSETMELIERFLSGWRLVTLQRSVPEAVKAPSQPQILLLDSSVRSGLLEVVLRCEPRAVNLLVFDTTCFAGSSGRIRRVLRWARRHDIPVVLVRSHNKLDSLGAEYGRLGSVAFVGRRGDEEGARSSILDRLEAETANAVRLFGGAAVPAHFPPYVGSEVYWDLTKSRVAAILRNGREAARIFARELGSLCAELHFTHGLYVTLRPARSFDEAGARQAAEALSRDLARDGHQIRHAGSFGFDFASTEWVRNTTTGEYNVRVAVPDLPTRIWNELVRGIASWWSKNLG